MEVLVSDSLEGREAGEPGQKRAARFIAAHFAKNGARGIDANSSYFQTFFLKKENIVHREFRVNGSPLEFLKDFYYWPGIPEREICDEKILFVGYGIKDSLSGYNSFASLNGENAVLMALQDEPIDKNGRSLITGTERLSDWSRSSRMKIEYLKSLRPRILIIVSNFFEDDVQKWGHYLKQPRIRRYDQHFSEDQIPVVFVTWKFADNLLKKNGLSGGLEEWKKSNLNNFQPKPVIINTSICLKIVKKLELIPTENVIGWFEGTDKKDECIVVSAHYDHLGLKSEGIYRGADDNASGTACLMEIVRLLNEGAKRGIKPRRSIVIIATTAEEKGLLGSSYYVEKPLFSLENTIANLNADMIGRRDSGHLPETEYIYIIGSHFLSRELHKINEEVNDSCVGLLLDYRFNDPDEPNRLYYRSDHYNFARNDIPCIFYFSGLHEDYHQVTDTIEKLDFQLLSRRTRLIFETLWHLAQRNNRLFVDKP
ncbi:MAG: M20/M25/M40 family metallo-hydrolase [Flavobacteriales bacterium]|nr:M20/M25/M40 family metallo-hydrolase [Flavobacteriales bacterium]